MDMNKKDLKRLSKSQLIKLLLKQEAKKPSNSVNKSSSLLENLNHQHKMTLSILMMTYSKQKTKALKISK